MNEKTIITAEDIRKVRPIAENLHDVKRITPYIREVESLDVMQAIGVSLYKQITEWDNSTNETITINVGSGKKTLSSEEWAKFLNGGFYTCGECACSDDTKYSGGLLAAISYLAYARMLPNQPLNVTAFGAVQKTTNFSEPVDEKTLFRASNEARKIGLEYLAQSVEHLRCEGFIDCRKRMTARYRKFKAIG